MNFWITAQKTYDTATDKFDRAVLSRGFAVLFMALAAAILYVGLVVNIGSYSGFVISPILLLVLVGFAAVFWVSCVVLQDKRQAIKGWFHSKVLVHSPHLEVLPDLKTSFRSVTPSSQDRPPRFTPRAKS